MPHPRGCTGTSGTAWNGGHRSGVTWTGEGLDADVHLITLADVHVWHTRMCGRWVTRRGYEIAHHDDDGDTRKTTARVPLLTSHHAPRTPRPHPPLRTALPTPLPLPGPLCTPHSVLPTPLQSPTRSCHAVTLSRCFQKKPPEV